MMIDIFLFLIGAGATDLLVEWEDMFPYWGPIANISAKYVHFFSSSFLAKKKFYFGGWCPSKL